MEIEPAREHTQPYPNTEEINNRRYVYATWKPIGEGEGNPKIGGGFSISKNNTTTAPNGLNRPKQRYVASIATLRASREAKATAEYADSIILRRSPNRYQIRAKSGNQYETVLTPEDAWYDRQGNLVMCDCPDAWRLAESGYGLEVYCKHVLMLQIYEQTEDIASMPACCEYIADLTGFSVRKVQDECYIGGIPATKVENVWSIPFSQIGSAVAYLEEQKVYPYSTWQEIVG